jgi:DNA-directed RNA polymerase subunit RPC12/RpoP
MKNVDGSAVRLVDDTETALAQMPAELAVTHPQTIRVAQDSRGNPRQPQGIRSKLLTQDTRCATCGSVRLMRSRSRVSGPERASER